MFIELEVSASLLDSYSLLSLNFPHFHQKKVLLDKFIGFILQYAFFCI